VRLPPPLPRDEVTQGHHLGLRCTPAFGHTSVRSASDDPLLKLDRWQVAQR
jgi:hypothetical protein